MRELLFEVARDAGGVGDPVILYHRTDVLVVRVGEVVVKSHRPAADLAARLAVASSHPDLLLAPLAGPQEIEGRTVSVWPAGETVDPADPEKAPWEEAARLLADLHARPLPPGLPEQGAPAKVREVLSRPLPEEHPATAPVRRAYASLPPFPEPARPPRLVHGDFHLGQLVRYDGTWRLIDLDDLGRGDPVWDLARPAALFAAGVLQPEAWSRFLGAYREHGGIDLGEDPWEKLDIPARALAIQTAARCVSHAVDENRLLDPYESALIDTCDRIGGLAV
ncbi:phosphotransferase [Actinocorallia aurantiaca]|uniref:phosphotransferase n=1 Tax=Actinocorallia aurantiaca TaxID=46204 RepID=UPI0031D31FF9